MANNNDDNLIIEIELDDGKLAKGFVAADKVAKRSGKKAGRDFGNSAYKASKGGLLNLRNTLLGLGTAFAGAFAARKVIEAAKVQENAVNEINTALQLSGQYTAAASRDFQTYASSLQATSTIGDEVILQNAALIQNLGKLEVDALKPATKAALDMAAALNIDLRAAATLVGKAAAGEISSFTRYGVVIEKGATKAETFANTLKALNDSFNGAAAAKVNTFDGAFTQLSNTFGDLQESIGFYVTKSPAIIATMKVVSKAIKDTIGRIDTLRDSKKSVDSFSSGFFSLGQNIIDYFVRPMEIALNVSRVVIGGIKTGLQGLLTLFGQVIGGLADFANMLGVDNDITKGIQTFRESTSEVFEEMALDTSASLGKIFDTDFSSSSENLLGKIRNVTNKISDEVAKIKVKTKESTDGVVDNFKDVATKIGPIIQNGIVRMVSTGIETIGASLVQGGSAFNNFGNVVIGLMGDLAIQVGTAILTTGQAIEALRASVVSMFGGQAIAAGIALIALGGAMKAYAGSATETAASGSVAAQTGGDSYGTQQGESSSFNDDPEIERRADSQINVTIQGNVLDGDESGLKIVEMINKSIRDQGAVLA